MVPREVVERLLREALEALEIAKSIVESMSLDEFLRDTKSRYALRYSLVLIAEALADIAVAILEKDFNVRPGSYRESFMMLAARGVVEAETAREMERLAAHRNLIIHRYWRVDDARLYQEAREGA